MCETCNRIEIGTQSMYDLTRLKAGQCCLAAELTFARCLSTDDHEKLMEMSRYLSRYREPSMQLEMKIPPTTGGDNPQ